MPTERKREREKKRELPLPPFLPWFLLLYVTGAGFPQLKKAARPRRRFFHLLPHFQQFWDMDMMETGGD